MAAVLACGPDAVLSHWVAAMHWELLQTRRAVIDVSVPSHRAVKGVRSHWVKLHPRDCTRRERIPITTVPRTLLDLAAVANERVLRRAVNEADRRGKLNRNGIQELLQRNHRRAGAKALRAVIAAVDPQASRSRSDLELDFLALLRRYRLPIPVMNAEVAGYRVDMHWPGTNLIVEIDSYEYHRTPAEFHNDRRRDADLTTKGYVVIRISDHWLATDPQGVAETVRYAVTSGSIASSE